MQPLLMIQKKHYSKEAAVTEETFEHNITQLRSVLEVAPTLVVDVETNGLDSFGTNQICGIGVGEPNNEGLTQYYPFRHHEGGNLSSESLQSLITLLNQLVKSYIGYNLKFDLHFLEKEGLSVVDKKLIDVIVMVRLVEHSDIKELGLSATGKRNYGQEAIQYDDDTKKVLKSNKGWFRDFSKAPADILGEYCQEDVRLTTKLYNDYLKKIHDSKQIDIFEMECNLTRVLYAMESRGISVDKRYALDVEKQISSRLTKVETEILNISGRKKWNHELPMSSKKHEEEEFNISSPKQIGEVFNKMGIESPVKTLKGQDSWNEAALININHRMAGLIRQYRTLEKLKSTYILPYLEIDTMHTSFCNWGTATGRLSSRDPNLQNIPRNHFKLVEKDLNDQDKIEIRDKISAMVGQKGITMDTELSDDVLGTWSFIGDESYDESDRHQIAIRRLFVPRKGYSLVGFDYSQMEVRVFMSYFRNETIDEILKKEDVDFHSESAKLAFNIDESSDQFKFYRQMAKAITFGTIYGIGNKKLAQQLNTSPREAGKFKRQYFEGMKGSKDFFDKVVAKVERVGTIRNKYGRVYQINPQFAYKGVNYLVQGTSADLLSERMLVVDDFLADKKSNILLQVHDEIICEIHDSELETVPYTIRDLLEINTLDIPLKVDMELCTPSWASKKELKILTLEDFVDWDDAPVTDSDGVSWG